MGKKRMNVKSTKNVKNDVSGKSNVHEQKRNVQEKKGSKLKQASAITLVSLIIVVVVLLILAGISLNLVLGDNGLIAKSKDAKNAITNMQDSTTEAREDLYGEIVGKKDPYDDGSTMDLYLVIRNGSYSNSLKLIGDARDKGSTVVRYDFYIKKADEDEKAYVKIPKDDPKTETVEVSDLENNAVYTAKVVAIDEKGKSSTATRRIVRGTPVTIKVTSLSEA